MSAQDLLLHSLLRTANRALSRAEDRGCACSALMEMEVLILIFLSLRIFQPDAASADSIIHIGEAWRRWREWGVRVSVHLMVRLEQNGEFVLLERVLGLSNILLLK